jgi:hypothetical protein
MKAQYNAETGRDYCSVGPKKTEREREKKKKNVGAPIMCDGPNNGLFWTIFEDLRRD